MQPSYKGFQFKELIGEQGVSPCVHSWQDDANQAVMAYDLNWDEYVNRAASQIIGYSKASAQLNAAGVRTLNRVLPLRHPIWDWLWATRIQQAQPINLTGIESAESDSYATFEFARCAIGFQSLPYSVLSDADLLAISTPQGIPDESLRFVEKTGESMTETLEVQVGALKYLSYPIPYVWATVPRRKYQLVTKRVLTWTWHKVAHTYLMKTGTDIPANLDLVQNKVNNATWNGYPAGTLLFKSHKEIPVEAPTSPGSIGLPNNGPPREWKVVLTLIYFEPPKDPNPGVVYPPGAAGAGWNLEPAPQLITPWWYPVGDTVNGNPVYQSADFTKIFQSPN